MFSLSTPSAINYWNFRHECTPNTENQTTVNVGLFGVFDIHVLKTLKNIGFFDMHALHTLKTWDFSTSCTSTTIEHVIFRDWSTLYSQVFLVLFLRQ